ncbi:hypothetical protein [Paraburkholderia sp. HD33-4]|uniref:hypothetical protein n=1 Tax=Paraburkholderia sp. HD33-4 TaxID=2883242 RepID=UPI001F31A539|nr:hypothetical protein [Paraburkholderia sp. HD33-4]
MHALLREPDENEPATHSTRVAKKRRAKQKTAAQNKKPPRKTKNRPAMLRRFLNLELTRRIWSG